MKTQRNMTALALAVAMVTGVQPSFGNDHPKVFDALRPTITLRILREDGVNRRTVLRAEKEAIEILARSGVELVWVDCGAGTTDGKSGDPCQRALGTAEFWLRIVIHKPIGTTRDMLGFTELEEGAVRGAAGIYYPLAVELARTQGRDLFQILGAAMAHEVGHLILGVNAHFPWGVMSPRWGRTQFRQISSSQLDFSPDQAKRLRDELRRRTSSR